MDMTHAQSVLVRWVQFYTSIYELDEVERPSEEIIADDAELDKWMKKRQKEIRRKLKEYHKNMKTPDAEVDDYRPSNIIGTPDADSFQH